MCHRADSGVTNSVDFPSSSLGLMTMFRAVLKFETLVKTQVWLRLNVYAGICKDKIFGWHFFLCTLNGGTYFQFLRTEFEELRDNLSLLEYNRCYSQHDGPPSASTVTVTENLNARFVQTWIGNADLVGWPAKFPGFTFLSTFLWGCLKLKSEIIRNFYKKVKISTVNRR